MPVTELQVKRATGIPRVLLCHGALVYLAQEGPTSSDATRICLGSRRTSSGAPYTRIGNSRSSRISYLRCITGAGLGSAFGIPRRCCAGRRRSRHSERLPSGSGQTARGESAHLRLTANLHLEAAPRSILEIDLQCKYTSLLDQFEPESLDARPGGEQGIGPRTGSCRSSASVAGAGHVRMPVRGNPLQQGLPRARTLTIARGVE